MLSRRVAEALGIGPVWFLRGEGGETGEQSSPEAAVQELPAQPEPGLEAQPRSAVPHQVRPDLRKAFSEPLAQSPALVFPVSKACDPAVAGLGWAELEAEVSGCSKCRLCERRKQAVFGVGDTNADWLFVGEGPGAEEDARGEPFVGQAGKLLDLMLSALGLERGRGVYIANAVKCRPPNNRTPEPDETAACFPYLARQIELIQPRLIVALGRPAAQTLLGQEVRIGAARGKIHRFGDIPLVVTYHPAYLLRNPMDKAKSWADLCFARRTLADQTQN